MKENDFKGILPGHKLPKGFFKWKAPSNIALVKYWGKRPPQIPANPSISFTLDHCATRTVLHYEPLDSASEDYQFEIFLDGVANDSFRPKIATFMDRIAPYLPFIRHYKYRIETSNSFPHSSGIASSASGMAALSLCFLAMERELFPGMDESYFLRKASFLSRLGSGSASRSTEGPLMQWGYHKEVPGSSDLYAIKYPFPVHDIFRNFHDTILLVDKGTKQVSSTVGHQLMHDHPFAENRFLQAGRNLEKLQPVLADGDLEQFIALVESEALALHAMMMTSSPYFMLMKPNTLEILNRIWAYRQETGRPVCFTLDAGANVHLLYPDHIAGEVQQWIKSELAYFCENGQYIHDRVGAGATSH
ncbi:diphosphomevalonate/mevalonate 3,5-bisphosphate decarboxylase family protein [Zeaxanthinibacter enoshimensis]|uniref:diphosphomevalonate/mevalonate 3,5-bisphosphate decarboxylase family protein n=1 Tax=Zeaxanthinibacter enoshimensis TaxID=392009 RepID=UPI00356A55E5